MHNYYTSTIADTFTLLNSSEQGLSDEEARRRLEKYGINQIEKIKVITPLQILISQFTSFIVFILIAAVIISLLIGERLDAIVIAAILIINGIFGFVQEFKAEKAIEALRKLTALKAHVIREGAEREIDSRELVPGDVMLLEAGSKVPADARLIHTATLHVDESSLTGESVPREKTADRIERTGVTIADQENMVFMGTVVTNGHARAVITNTGMDSEIGKIAKMVQEVEEKLTPLQEKLKEFGKWLGIVTIGICAVVFVVGVLRDYFATGVVAPPQVSQMFLAAVALAVAAIPEGLPAIVTISMAFGVRRMVKRNALIRKLPAIETLGCTNVICSDKTGTLTKNEMTVRELFTDDKMIRITGEGYSPQDAGVDLLLRIGALCNNSRLKHNGKRWELFGDPTEGALQISALKMGHKKQELEERYPRIDEIPFDSKRKCMTTIHRVDGEKVAYVKGAADVILDKCTHLYLGGKKVTMTDDHRQRILAVNQGMAERALRVLGFAYRSLPERYTHKPEDLEHDLVFVGMQAMIDPPREEVKEAIEKCKGAGIKTVVITGDHKLTALAITKELGLFQEGDRALSGEELDAMNDEELHDIVEQVEIYARVSPEHKVKILKALKSKGHIVAMTGDGVNDAPALKRSDIGIAMGITGTDVSKEASDMVLTDDNFASIVSAVEEGRGIYSNIQQFIQYTLSSNLGEILVIFLAILIGWPLPLIAIQILWVNLLTDGLPGLALGLDPLHKDIMKRPPRRREEKIINREVIDNIIIVGIVMAAGTLFMFYSYDIETLKAKSIAFTTLIIFQMFNVLTYRAKNFKIDVMNSLNLIGSVIISVLLQFVVLYTPLSTAFKTVPLGLMDWLYVILVSCTLYIILEARKMIIKRHNKVIKRYNS